MPPTSILSYLIIYKPWFFHNRIASLSKLSSPFTPYSCDYLSSKFVRWNISPKRSNTSTTFNCQENQQWKLLTFLATLIKGIKPSYYLQYCVGSFQIYAMSRFPTCQLCCFRLATKSRVKNLLVFATFLATLFRTTGWLIYPSASLNYYVGSQEINILIVRFQFGKG